MAETGGAPVRSNGGGAERPALPTVAILADSRGFDTYYLTAAYGDAAYGYQHTFPALLRRDLLSAAQPIADAIHIPDHFRAASVANNILRLALTDPDIVVLLDGIWETLLSKEHFLAYVQRQVQEHDWRGGAALDLSFSSRRLVDLFQAGELPVSPDAYANRLARILSYFRRRGRRCVWLTLPVPPRDHLDGLHYAGNYMTLPEWGECLAALNTRLVPLVERYGGTILDLDALMADAGGAADC